MRARVSSVNNASKTTGRPFRKGNSAAKTDVTGRKQRTDSKPTPAQEKARFKTGNRGRPPGAKNKVTSEQRQAARELFTPLAEKALDKGKKHLNKCKLDGCGSCQFWAKISIEYAYGKPSQPIEIDPVALRAELESIAALAGKSVEEIEAEAAEVGVRIMADYRRATAR